MKLWPSVKIIKVSDKQLKIERICTHMRATKSFATYKYNVTKKPELLSSNVNELA